MNEMQIFKYNAAEVRTVIKDDEPWWVLRDVCDVIGLGSPHKVAERLDEDERNQIPLPHPQNPERTVAMTVISEAGLYNVIIRSDKPEAKAFKRWVTHEVLPSIRKNGAYAVAEQKLPQLTINELILKMAESNVELERKVLTLEASQAEISQKLDRAVEVIAAPREEDWRERMENAIHAIRQSSGMMDGRLRGHMYAALENSPGRYNLTARLTLLKKRTRAGGATYKEAERLTKLDVISHDKELMAIFEGIVKQYQARYVAAEIAAQ